MELIFELVAACRAGMAHFGESSGALFVPLFLAGLVGSAIHCAGMCGPFVLGQAMSDAAGRTARYGEWQRLAGAALLPYHLGRLTTYAGLGAAAGAGTSLLAPTIAFAWISGALLLLGALLMLAQAIGLSVETPSAWAGVLVRLTRPFVCSRAASARYMLGLVLGFLPCGLIYGALGMAASTGSALTGALAMASFAAGTMPALIALGWGGLLLRRRWQRTARWIAVPLLTSNAMLMLALAGARL